MLHLHVDAQAGDRLFWFTTTGWMMWNFIVSGLLTEATVLLYDGSPGYPDMDVLWDFAARTRMTTFGTSASYIGACMKAGVEPASGRDLSALQAVGSTGSPLSPEGFRWVYEHVGADTWLFSTSGGTDLCTAFVGGVPLRAGVRGRAAGARAGRRDRVLGPRRQAADRRGRRARASPSRCRRCRSTSGATRTARATARRTSTRTRAIWRHGDWIEITERGTAIITGRSDATINRGGIRMGTAEIYRAVLARRRGHRRAGGRRPGRGLGRLDAAVRGAARGRVADDDVVAEIRRRVREDCSPRHVPSDVIAGRGGPAHAVGQGARAAGQADTDGDAGRAGGGTRTRWPIRRRWMPFVELAEQRST